MGNLPDEFDLPEPLRRALEQLDTPPGVPSAIDQRILHDARDGFARRNRFRKPLWWTVAGAAAAASIVVAFTMSRPANRSIVAVAGDLDANGHVDIVDALLLARQIEAHKSPSIANDMNHDGAVTQADVEQIAIAAVRLPRAETLQ